MPKTRDVSPKLREFNKIFEIIANRHGWGEVYRDFIDYSTACMLWEGDKELAAQLERKYKKEYADFRLLFFEWQHWEVKKQEIASNKAEMEIANKMAAVTVKEEPTVGKFGQLSFF